MSNEIKKPETTQLAKPNAKDFFQRDDIKKKFEQLLGQKAQSFITSVLQLVSNNKLLQNADPISIYNSACVSAILDLPINQNLGFAYIVPYNESYQDVNGQWQKRQVAQFMVGYKGFIQLAQRSGQFQTISATPIYDGQLIECNPLTGYVFDFTKKASEKVIGYAGYFKLLNGFEKTMYSSVDELTAHGRKYSQTFKRDSGVWKDNFDSMAIKTILKLMLSKYAPLSVEMQKAVTIDQAVIRDETGTDIAYVDVTNDANNYANFMTEEKKQSVTDKVANATAPKTIDVEIEEPKVETTKTTKGSQTTII